MKRESPGKFLSYYRGLNPAQKEAVDTIEGPVMVVAGPGTGKTQVLTLRIANILRQTDAAPDSILALTFTNSGVYSMRKRLVAILGSRGYRIHIHTFHSFCNDLIRRYPEKFPRIISSTNALAVDQIRILEQIISETKLHLLKPFGDPHHYVQSILFEIKKLKEENIDPKRLTRILKEEEKKLRETPDLYHEKGPYAGRIRGKYQEFFLRLEKEKELATVYKKYEAALALEKLYDFSDMVMEVIRVLASDPDFLLVLQEEYQYILADEHQDANQTQNKLLELLASFHPEPNLFIVGDEKQAIFQFQGASLDNFNYFRRLYPKAKLITLTENYRSTQIILDSARSLIGASGLIAEESKVRLVANLKAPERHIAIRAFSRPDYEYLFLVDEIKEKLLAGVRPEEIAVLYRDNSDALPVIDYLERAGIPFVVRSDADVLDDVEIEKLTLLLRTINAFGDDKYLLQLLHVDFFKVEILDLYDLVEGAREKKCSLYHLMKKRKKFLKLYQNLVRWKKLAANRPFLDLFGELVKESGFLAHLLSLPDSSDKLGKLEALYQEAQTLARNNRHLRLADFVRHLNLLSEHHLPVRRLQDPLAQGVQLLTAHRSKGLEYDYVYLINAYDGHWGNKRSSRHFQIPTRPGVPAAVEKNDDERRLFYVALTRARREVTISFAVVSNEGQPRLPSQFIGEIDGRFIEQVPVEEWETKQIGRTDIIFAAKSYVGRPIFDPAYLAERFQEQGLSATALNNYLRCPLNYLFANLLGVIQVRNKHVMYGIAVHAALEDFFKRYQKGEDLSREAFLENFHRALSAQPISQADFEDSLRRGTTALSGYYEAYYPNWSREILSEHFVRGVELDKDIKIKGKIDKIEFQGAREVRVVDYKTSAPKSRREIEGLTRGSTGDYKRQLLFYKLLLEGSEKGKFKVSRGMIDFIEPNARGKYKQEEFILGQEEAEELKRLIKKVGGEIKSGVFLERGCGDKTCPGCRLRQMMGR